MNKEYCRKKVRSFENWFSVVFTGVFEKNGVQNMVF